MVMEQLERYRGAMLGLAVGDALGAPMEGLKDGHIVQLFGRVEGFVDAARAFSDKPRRWRLSGLYTDDTQQALALADALVKCRGLNRAYFAGLLLDLARAETGLPLGAHRGAGDDFRATINALQGKTPADQAGRPSAGVAPMARAAPVGLYFAGEGEALLRAAIEQGLVTHRDPRALVMAAVMARAVELSVSGAWDRMKPALRAADLLEPAAAAERMVEREYIHLIPVACMDRFGLALSGLQLLPRLYELPSEKMAFNQIVAEANRQFPEHKITEPGQGFVMAAGLSALFIALAAPDFEDGVLRAVRLGKDTDTMAAIVGAILGARLGESAIPGPWRAKLVNAGQVAARGEALLNKCFDGLAIKDLVKMETELTVKEEELRKAFILKQEQRGEIRPSAPKKDQQEVPTPAYMPSALDRKKKRQKTRREKAPWKK